VGGESYSRSEKTRRRKEVELFPAHPWHELYTALVRIMFQHVRTAAEFLAGKLPKI